MNVQQTYKQGVDALVQDNLQVASQALMKVRELEPTHVGANMSLALLLFKAQKFIQAATLYGSMKSVEKADLKKAAADDGKQGSVHATALLNLAMLQAEAREELSFTKEFSSSHKSNALDPLLKSITEQETILLTQSSYLTSVPDEQVEIIKLLCRAKATKLAEELATTLNEKIVHLARGVISLAAGDIDGAQHHFDLHASLHPKKSKTTMADTFDSFLIPNYIGNRRGKDLFEIAKILAFYSPEAAFKKFQGLVKEFPNDEEVLIWYFKLSLVLKKEENFLEVCCAISKTETLSHHDLYPIVAQLLASSYPKQVQQIFENMLSVLPRKNEYAAILAFLYSTDNQLERAQQLIEERNLPLQVLDKSNPSNVDELLKGHPEKLLRLRAEQLMEKPSLLKSVESIYSAMSVNDTKSALRFCCYDVKRVPKIIRGAVLENIQLFAGMKKPNVDLLKTLLLMKVLNKDELGKLALDLTKKDECEIVLQLCRFVFERFPADTLWMGLNTISLALKKDEAALKEHLAIESFIYGEGFDTQIDDKKAAALKFFNENPKLVGSTLVNSELKAPTPVNALCEVFLGWTRKWFFNKEYSQQALNHPFKKELMPLKLSKYWSLEVKYEILKPNQQPQLRSHSTITGFIFLEGNKGAKLEFWKVPMRTAGWAAAQSHVDDLEDVELAIFPSYQWHSIQVDKETPIVRFDLKQL